MKRILSALAVASAFTIAPAANAGVLVTPTSQPAGTAFLVSGDPFDGQVSAFFGRTGIAATLEDTDIFAFRIGQNGLGTGDITSTSVSLDSIGDLDLLEVIFNNGVSNFVVNLAGGTDADEGGSLSNIPIFTDALNTLSIRYRSYGNGKYSGTLDFVPNAAVPEPATWAMLILGFALVGFSMRRRSKENVRVSFAM